MALVVWLVLIAILSAFGILAFRVIVPDSWTSTERYGELRKHRQRR